MNITTCKSYCLQSLFRLNSLQREYAVQNGCRKVVICENDLSKYYKIKKKTLNLHLTRHLHKTQDFVK